MNKQADNYATFSGVDENIAGFKQVMIQIPNTNISQI